MASADDGKTEFSVLLDADVDRDDPDVQRAVLQEVAARLERANGIPSLIDLRGVHFGQRIPMHRTVSAPGEPDMCSCGMVNCLLR